MSDKMRVTFPVAVTFADGELPSAAKLSALGKQARNGLGLIEYAVGDLWNSGGDLLFSTLTAANLMIPNLSRLIGASYNLSPRIPYLPDLEEYTYDFTNEAGTYTVRLPYPVSGISTFTWAGGTAKDAAPVASKDLVLATGNWYLDYSNGTIIAYDTFTASEILTYAPDVSNIYDISQDATFNVIPDPDTDTNYAFHSVKIQYVAGPGDSSQGYYIFLPPRGPLNTRRLDLSPQDDLNAPVNSNNMQVDPTAGSRTMFQDDGQPADTSVNAAHYRYNLPNLLTDNWAQATTIPAGFVYLWDPAGSKTIIEGVVFSSENAATPRTWVLIAQGANLDTYLGTTQGLIAYSEANLNSSSHTASYYPITGLQVITVGTSLTHFMSSLLEQFLNHDHSEPGSLINKQVMHSALKNLVHNTTLIPSSAYPMDDHPQYIHRYGVEREGTDRDIMKGAMLGNLLFAANNDTLSEYRDSYKISFGLDEDVVDIFYQLDSGCLVLSTYARSVSIRDPYNATESNTRGEEGILYCNYIRPGSHNQDTVITWDDGSSTSWDYEWNGDQDSAWGPIRSHILFPTEFQIFEYNPISRYLNNTPSCCAITSLATDCYFTMTSIAKTNYVVAFCPIHLPFAQYAIVNIHITLQTDRNITNAGKDLVLTILKIRESASLAGSLENSVTYPSPFVRCGPRDLIGRFGTAGVLYAVSGFQGGYLWRDIYFDINTEPDAASIIDNTWSTSNPVGYIPCIRINLTNLTDDIATTISFGNMMILYRVKEF